MYRGMTTALNEVKSGLSKPTERGSDPKLSGGAVARVGRPEVGFEIKEKKKRTLHSGSQNCRLCLQFFPSFVPSPRSDKK